MTKKLSTLLLAAALFSGGASAQGYYGGSGYQQRPGFNYVGVGYRWQSLDATICDDQDGLELDGSIMVNEQIFVQGRYTDVEGSGGCGSTTGSVGAGMRANFGRAAAVYGAANLLYRDYEPEGDADPGFGLELGIRNMITNQLELGAFVGFEKVDELEESFAGVGIDYELTQEFSLTGDFTLTDEGTEAISAGLRLNF